MTSSATCNLFDQLPHGYRVDQRLGPVYDEAPAGADDLTAVRGIGTRQAIILNRLGVYFYSQIALWGHLQICAFADELGRSVSALTQAQWVEQSRVLCRPRRGPASHTAKHRPASMIRTFSLICCALLIGCLLVYWLNARDNNPMRGVLSADITALRVPSESRLLTIQVSQGQEVFTGDELLTLEKTEHLQMIQEQKELVADLQRQLHKAEAQATLDLAWRTRELDRELSDIRARAELIQEVKRSSDDAVRSASVGTGQVRPIAGQSSPRAKPAAHRRYQAERGNKHPNSIMFIGASGESTPAEARNVDTSIPSPPALLPVETRTVMLTSESGSKSMLSVEVRSIESRLARLEELRRTLPDQVRRAAGVEGIQVRFDEASQRLQEMQTVSRDVAVLCPAYGRIGQVHYLPGETMRPGEVMLRILHPDRRFVILNVPTERVNEIQAGNIVELMFPGQQQYQGKIANVPPMADNSLPGDRTTVTVRIEPTGRFWPEIPVGSQIEVIVPSGGLF